MNKLERKEIQEEICIEYERLIESGMTVYDAVRYLQKYGQSNSGIKYTRAHIRNILTYNNLYEAVKRK